MIIVLNHYLFDAPCYPQSKGDFAITLALALPFVPGGKEKLMEVHRDVTGPLRASHLDWFRRHRFRENWYLQPTPMGEVVLLYVETEDLGKLFGGLQQTRHPYDVAHIEKAKAVHGVDFSQPPAGPLPELLLQTTDSAETEYEQNLAILLPFRAGGAERLRALANAVTGAKYNEHQDFMRRHNFRENWYIQPTPAGEYLILYLETDDLGRLFGECQTTVHPYDHWHFDEAVAIHGVDFRQPPAGPLPSVLYESRKG